jgi:hypothetical protein
MSGRQGILSFIARPRPSSEPKASTAGEVTGHIAEAAPVPSGPVYSKGHPLPAGKGATVWQYFTPLVEDGKEKAKCFFCG